MANEPRKPFQSPAPLPLPTPPGGTQPKAADKSAPAMPLWTSGGGDKLGGMPLFRGAGQKPNSLMGRLKGLKTKDVAFIGAGLAVLVMAPLAEYLISEGEEPNTLTQGFAQNGMPFPNGTDPAEVGILGLAQGGIPGEATDVITPLNARDPSTLIVGGGNGEQKEPPAAASAEPKRDAPKDSVWDKVVSSAKTGASSAARKVSLPKPGGKLAGALNGLRSLSGGSTGASLKLAAPDSKGLFSAPRNSSHLAASQAVPGYRGAGPRVIAGGSGGNLAGRGGNPFGGSGGGAAGDVMSGGISGGGRGSGFSGGDGDPTKNPGGNSTKDNKTLGESLAFLRQKMEMEKAIDLKWAKKRYDELERKKMIEQTLVQTAQQAFMKVLDKLLEGKKDGGASPGGGPSGGPSGGKPDAPGGKPPAPGSPAALPSGVGRVAPVSKPEAKPSATETLTAADKTHKEAGKALGQMEGNAGALDKLGAGLDTRDATMAKIKTSLDGASKEVRDAASLLAKENEKPAKSIEELQAANKELGTRVDTLDGHANTAKALADKANEEAAKLKTPEWKKGEQYPSLVGGASPDAVKPDEVKKGLDALAAKEAVKIPAKPDVKGDVQSALGKLQQREAAIAAVYDEAIAAAQRTNNAEFVTAFTTAKQEMTRTMAQVRENLQTAGTNVETAAQAVDSAIQATHDLNGGYGKALRSVAAKVRAIESAKESLSEAVTAYEGGGTTTVNDDGVTMKTGPNTARTGAQGKAKTAVEEVAKSKTFVDEAKRRK